MSRSAVSMFLFVGGLCQVVMAQNQDARDNSECIQFLNDRFGQHSNYPVEFLADGSIKPTSKAVEAKMGIKEGQSWARYKQKSATDSGVEWTKYVYELNLESDPDTESVTLRDFKHEGPQKSLAQVRFRYEGTRCTVESFGIKAPRAKAYNIYPGLQECRGIVKERNTRAFASSGLEGLQRYQTYLANPPSEYGKGAASVLGADTKTFATPENQKVLIKICDGSYSASLLRGREVLISEGTTGQTQSGDSTH